MSWSPVPAAQLPRMAEILRLLQLVDTAHLSSHNLANMQLLFPDSAGDQGSGGVCGLVRNCSVTEPVLLRQAPGCGSGSGCKSGICNFLYLKLYTPQN